MTLLLYFTLLNLLDAINPGMFNWTLMSIIGVVIWIFHFLGNYK